MKWFLSLATIRLLGNRIGGIRLDPIVPELTVVDKPKSNKGTRSGMARNAIWRGILFKV
jgi:hypothetical protein